MTEKEFWSKGRSQEITALFIGIVLQQRPWLFKPNLSTPHPKYLIVQLFRSVLTHSSCIALGTETVYKLLENG